MNSAPTVTPVRKLTAKQRKFLKIYSETLNATEAAMQVYDCKDRNVAKAIGSENLAKLDFMELMDASGLTEDYLVVAVKEGTRATRPILANGKLQAVADYSARHKYVDTAFKLRGKLNDASKLELSGPDGEPLRIELVAGIGFLNKPKDEND